jgi:hypothetical protein
MTLRSWPMGIPPIKPPPWVPKMLAKLIQLRVLFVLASIILSRQLIQIQSMLASKTNAVNQHQFTLHLTPNPILLNTYFNTETHTLSPTSHPTPLCNTIIFPPYHNIMLPTIPQPPRRRFTMITPPHPAPPPNTTTLRELNIPIPPWKQNIFCHIKHQKVLTHNNTN